MSFTWCTRVSLLFVVYGQLRRISRKSEIIPLFSEFHGRNDFRLYDDRQPVVPFSALKTEYEKEFCAINTPRSRSVPNKFDLNATTEELLDALRDDDTEIVKKRQSRFALNSLLFFFF